jgi:hypothetical protein
METFSIRGHLLLLDTTCAIYRFGFCESQAKFSTSETWHVLCNFCKRVKLSNDFCMKSTSAGLDIIPSLRWKPLQTFPKGEEKIASRVCSIFVSWISNASRRQTHQACAFSVSEELNALFSPAVFLGGALILRRINFIRKRRGTNRRKASSAALSSSNSASVDRGRRRNKCIISKTLMRDSCARR